eukprot:m.914643 g.914643  ORF g.914643 m.914643 type:complete len:53 (+) comp60142_c0_seq8:5026-5184(+)
MAILASTQTTCMPENGVYFDVQLRNVVSQRPQDTDCISLFPPGKSSSPAGDC